MAESGGKGGGARKYGQNKRPKYRAKGWVLRPGYGLVKDE